MVSTRPPLRRLAVPRLRWPDLPSSANHGVGTQRALYAVGLSQAALAVVCASLAIAGHTGFFLDTYLFWVPCAVALLGLVMTAIGHLGSLSAPWLSALVNLPLALTALYVNGVLASTVLVAALLGSAGWLAVNLLDDSAQRDPDEF